MMRHSKSTDRRMLFKCNHATLKDDGPKNAIQTSIVSVPVPSNNIHQLETTQQPTNSRRRSSRPLQVSTSSPHCDKPFSVDLLRIKAEAAPSLSGSSTPAATRVYCYCELSIQRLSFNKCIYL